MSEQEAMDGPAKCPNCGGRLLEIRKDDYPEYIRKEDVEGFRQRFVCRSCGSEYTYDSIEGEWGEVPDNSPYHYGRRGNRLLHRVGERRARWVRENWQEIQGEYIDFCLWAGLIDGEENEEAERWASGLGGEGIVFHLRQISDELSGQHLPDMDGSIHPIACEIMMLAKRLEELVLGDRSP